MPSSFESRVSFRDDHSHDYGHHNMRLGRWPVTFELVSVAHELSGLGSTRVVRFSASGWRRIDEPDDVATGPQDGEVSGCFEPMGAQGAVGDGGGRDSRCFGT